MAAAADDDDDGWGVMCKQHDSNMHDEKTRRKDGIFGAYLPRCENDSLRGTRAQAAQRRRR